MFRAKQPSNTAAIFRFFKSTVGILLLITLLIASGVHLITGNFFTAYTLPTFIRQATFTILIAMAQTIVLLTGGIDLSVASISCFSSIVFAFLLVKIGIPAAICLLVAIVCGLLLGLVNGFFISSFHLTPFIVTLCTSYLFRGVVYVMTKGAPIAGIPRPVAHFGSGSFWSFLPYPTVYMIVLVLLLFWLLKFTGMGRHIYAVGGNEQAAIIVGIDTKRVKMLVYGLSGVICAITGILMALRLGSSQLSIGSNWVMPSITAAVIGGTSMKGGVGGVWGTIAGGLLVTVITFTISVLRIPSYWEEIMTGGVVLAAISADALRSIRARK